MWLMWRQIFLYLLLLNSVAVSQYVNGTTLRLKRKITNMNTELIKDVIAKIKSVRNLREMNYHATAYQVGDILCTVRSLLGRIVQLYKQVELNDISDEELFDKFEKVHNSWYTIEHLIRMVEQWEGRNTGRRSSFDFHVGGKEESKRWTLLEEGERLDNIRLKGGTLDRGDSTQRKKKRKLWKVGIKDGMAIGF